MADQIFGTANPRRLRVCAFNTWARSLEESDAYVERAAQLDVREMIADPDDLELLRKARLDCDWYAENVRCFARLQHPRLQFLPAWVTGAQGLLDLARAPRQAAEERWLVFTGHQPQAVGGAAPQVFRVLAGAGIRLAFYAFDEASRFMPCFRALAPHLSVLIHDEDPLDEPMRRLLPAHCVVRRRSWVANVEPFSPSFCEAPEPRIVFLGSQLGLSDHRKRQIRFLQEQFKDRFVAYHDHSVPVADRMALNRFAASFCPEGRKFATPAMARSHTDRPFWSGCLGMVPISEDSRSGGRLDDLARAELIVQYPHGDLGALRNGCERALAYSKEARRRIYEHFNREETVGIVLAEALAAARS